MYIQTLNLWQSQFVHSYPYCYHSQESYVFEMFFPKDIYLGEKLSTVCSVHVGGWAGVGACSAEGVGGPAGSAGGRLGVDARSSFVFGE